MLAPKDRAGSKCRAISACKTEAMVKEMVGRTHH